MSDSPQPNPEKNPTWFFYALAIQTFVIIVLGMLKDLMWIL